MATTRSRSGRLVIAALSTAFLAGCGPELDKSHSAKSVEQILGPGVVAKELRRVEAPGGWVYFNNEGGMCFVPAPPLKVEGK